MSKLGANLRCVAEVQHREAIADFYVQVFGADAVHPMPDLDVYTMSGSNIGVYFVPRGQALTVEQQQSVGTWIEIIVDDVDAVTAVLAERGLQPLQYHDQEHSYFQAPGGQVFRLAGA